MIDACCVLCRTPSGVCASKFTCQHHKEAEAQDAANDRARRTVRRPTEDQAIANVMRAQKVKRRPRPRTYKEEL